MKHPTHYLIFGIALLLLGSPSLLLAQQDLPLLSQLQYNSNLNDVWAYVTPDGTEYALVGSRDGLSIVDLSELTQPKEVLFLDGGNSVWRDIKTWEHYAYVTTDQDGTTEGIWIVDLSELPDNATFSRFKPYFPNFEDTLFTCHNLYIDEFGLLYLAGCNVNNGGTIMYDLTTDPQNPTYLGPAEFEYSHDVYARDQILYTSNIYAGGFTVIDVSTPATPEALAFQKTPFEFTHNAWLSDDGKTLFTTDERRDAPVASYDISDLNDIRLLDEFRPVRSLNRGVIPHNVHVFNNYLVISHYTDGCVIVDAARPHNLVQVGQYDPTPDNQGGFSGAWGAYPFLPSGVVLISDIQEGLLILQPNYQRACYLEGKVTDALSGIAIFDVEVRIQSDEPNLERTDLGGRYATGQVTAGTFEVIFEKAGYKPASASVNLDNGVLTNLDITLEPLPVYALNGTVADWPNQTPLQGAVVQLENRWVRYKAITDAQGNFSFPEIFQYNDYTLKWNKWGYEYAQLNPYEIAQENEEVLYLSKGYMDNFELDLGWQVLGDADEGEWVRVIPQETRTLNAPANPGTDSPLDLGEHCFVTGNGFGEAYADEIDRGHTILRSPTFDLTDYNHPMAQFDYWFVNLDQNSNPADDVLEVFIENGLDTALLLSATESDTLWRTKAIDLANEISLTEQMHLLVITGDQANSPNLVEGGFDHFRIYERVEEEDYLVREDGIFFTAFPNPTTAGFQVDYQISPAAEEVQFQLFDALGRQIRSGYLPRSQGSFYVPGSNLSGGVYLLRILADDRVSKALRLIRI